jgi:hypothetical protein
MTAECCQAFTDASVLGIFVGIELIFVGRLGICIAVFTTDEVFA